MSHAAPTGLFFSLVLVTDLGADELAQEVSSALGVALRREQARGLPDDWRGEVLGMELWLALVDWGGPGSDRRYGLGGGPGRDREPHEHWLDASEIIADVLRRRTGRGWSTGG